MGRMFIPRVGQEVVVDYLNGNPDRPIIVGCVYNATTTVPYGCPTTRPVRPSRRIRQPAAAASTNCASRTRPAREEVFFQAQKDYNKVVLNNETVKITQDTTTTVDKGNRSITVSQGNNGLTVSQGNKTVTVSQGNNSVTVSQGNDSLTVSQGNHSITVSAGSSTVSAGQSITLKVGPNSITIDMSGITISGGTISLSADQSLSANGGASMTLKAGAIAIN